MLVLPPGPPSLRQSWKTVAVTWCRPAGFPAGGAVAKYTDSLGMGGFLLGSRSLGLLEGAPASGTCLKQRPNHFSVPTETRGARGLRVLLQCSSASQTVSCGPDPRVEQCGGGYKGSYKSSFPLRSQPVSKLRLLHKHPVDSPPCSAFGGSECRVQRQQPQSTEQPSACPPSATHQALC